MRFSLNTREFNVPAAKFKAVLVKDKKSDAIAYIWTQPGIGGAEYFLMKVFYGKQGKPAAYYRYKTAQEREAAVKRFFVARQEVGAYKSKRAAERKAFVNPYQVGQIFRCSWGYDQTNIDYFEVVARTEKTVTVREIAAKSVETSSMIGQCTPLPGSFIGKPKKCIVKGEYVKISSCQTGFPLAPMMIAGVPVYGTDGWTAYA